MNNKKEFDENIKEIIENSNFSKFRKSGFEEPYDLQLIAALEITDSFLRKESNYIILQGKCQAGKTGVFVGLCNLIYTNLLKNINTIYYITGDNSKDTNSRMKRSLESYLGDFNYKNILKQSALNTQFKKGEVPELSNCLIFIDESHYGTKCDGKDSNGKKANVIQNWLNDAYLNMKANKETLMSRNVYIVSCSATPWLEIYNDFGEQKRVVYLRTDEKYKGFEDFIKNKQFRLLIDEIEKEGAEGVRTICREWYEHLSNIKEKTGITKCVIARFSEKIQQKYKDIFKEYFMYSSFDSKSSNINYGEIEDWIKEKTGENPRKLELNKFPLVLIKGAYKMGNRINVDCKNMVGVCYDYVSSVDCIEATTQGLLGRMCGRYDTDDWKEVKFYIKKEHHDSLKAYVEQEKLVPELETEKTIITYTTEKREGCVASIQPLEEKCYNEYSIHEYLKQFEGTKFSKFDNFKLSDFTELKKANGCNLKSIVEPFLKEVDNWFNDALNYDPRFKSKYTKKNAWTDRLTFTARSNGYNNVLNEDNVGKKIYKFILDATDENNIIVKVIKGLVMNEIRQYECVTSGELFKPCHAFSTEKLNNSLVIPINNNEIELI